MRQHVGSAAFTLSGHQPAVSHPSGPSITCVCELRGQLVQLRPDQIRNYRWLSEWISLSLTVLTRFVLMVLKTDGLATSGQPAQCMCIHQHSPVQSSITALPHIFHTFVNGKNSRNTSYCNVVSTPPSIINMLLNYRLSDSVHQKWPLLCL